MRRGDLIRFKPSRLMARLGIWFSLILRDALVVLYFVFLFRNSDTRAQKLLMTHKDSFPFINKFNKSVRP